MDVFLFIAHLVRRGWESVGNPIWRLHKHDPSVKGTAEMRNCSVINMPTQFVQNAIQKQVYKKLILNFLYGCGLGRVHIVSSACWMLVGQPHKSFFVVVYGARFSLLVNLTTTLYLHKSYSNEREERSEVWYEKKLPFFNALSNKICGSTRDDQ